METRTCSKTGQPFVISDQEIVYCNEHHLPLPTIAPLERLRQAACFISSVFLYPGKCAFSGKEMLMLLPPESGFTVYDVDIWMSDQWDALDFGRDYDFSRPFFEQFGELLKAAPLPSLECIRSTMENSDYTNGVMNVKNCYLCFGTMECEDCLFSRTLISCKDVLDSVYVTNSELCYGCVHINNCYRLAYSEGCNDCSDASFLYNCKNCQYCYGSSNLINKQYYFRNQPLSKEAYEEAIRAIDLGSWEILQTEKARFAELKQATPVRFMQGKSNENSFGNYLENTKDCRHCLFVSESENVEWSVQMIRGTRNAFLCDGFGQNGENLYHSSAVGENAYNISFSYDCYSNVRDLAYCIFVGYGSTDCFGCVGLKQKQYCILNKQYTKEAYFELLPKIQAHMRSTGEYGHFFPQSLSPLYYNQSEAQVFMPLTKAAAIKLGYKWKDDQIETFTPTYTIPDHIDDVSDDILQATLQCAVTKRKYRIIKQELAAYRKLHIPVPRVSPIARLEAIQSALAIRETTSENCASCGTTIMTMYDPQIQEVLCERCFQKVII